MSRFRKPTHLDSSRVISGMSVEVKGDDQRAFDRAFRQFTKKVQNDGRLREARERKHYVKESTKRQLARKAARAKHLSDLRAQQPTKR
jgi:ribosomal protein S21